MTRLSGSRRRASILSAARRALAKRGFLGTRAQDIAKAAGVSEALLYRHFTSLEDLQRAVVRGSLKRTAAVFPDRLVGAEPPVALRTIAGDFLKTFEGDPDYLRLALFGALAGDPNSAVLLRREKRKAERSLLAILGSWKAKERIRTDVDLAAVAALLAAALLYEMIARCLPGPHRSARGLRRMMEGVAALLKKEAGAEGPDLRVVAAGASDA